MSQRHSQQKHSRTQQGSDRYQSDRVSPVVLALKDYWNRKRGGEGRQSPTKPRENNGMQVGVGGADKSIGGVAGNPCTERVGSDGGPRSTRRMVPSNCVFKDVADAATKCAEQ